MELGAVSRVIRDYHISPITVPRLGTTCVASLHERDPGPPGFMVLRGRSGAAPEEEHAFGASTSAARAPKLARRDSTVRTAATAFFYADITRVTLPAVAY